MSSLDSGDVEVKGRTRRARRSTQEIRDRILNAASALFEAKGYGGATTAAIAQHAGVAEALIFSNFGSKEKLFQASIFEPLTAELFEFCAAHPPTVAQSDEEYERFAKEYIARLETFLEKHSKKFSSLLFQQFYSEPHGGIDEIDGIQNYFDQASALAEAGARGGLHSDAGMMARVSFGAIFACVVFRRWLFPDGFANKDRIFAAVTDFVMDGLNGGVRKPTDDQAIRSKT